MPMSQQMPSDARNAEILGGRTQHVFEQVVRSKRPRSARVQKNPSILVRSRVPSLKLLESLELGFCEPDGTATSMRLWRIDFAIVHRFSDPQALMFPVDGFPAQPQQFADADSSRTAEPHHRSVPLRRDTARFPADAQRLRSGLGLRATSGLMDKSIPRVGGNRRSIEVVEAQENGGSRAVWCALQASEVGAAVFVRGETQKGAANRRVGIPIRH
jgi:hypothetical protein